MKQIAAAIAALAFAASPAAASAKDTLAGRWKNGPMEIVISPCGKSLCGTVVKASARQEARAERGSDTELIGARLITGIQPAGPDTYRARVFVADRGIHASGTIHQVTPNQLKVRGCVLGIICKSKTWDRVR
jgi:uncharacterized protein (DUF2147 family)